MLSSSKLDSIRDDLGPVQYGRLHKRCHLWDEIHWIRRFVIGSADQMDKDRRNEERYPVASLYAVTSLQYVST